MINCRLLLLTAVAKHFLKEKYIHERSILINMMFSSVCKLSSPFYSTCFVFFYVSSSSVLISSLFLIANSKYSDGSLTETNSFATCMWHLIDTLNEYRPRLFNFSLLESTMTCKLNPTPHPNCFNVSHIIFQIFLSRCSKSVD